MEVIATPINDLLVLSPRVFSDDRGYFFETYNKQTFSKINISNEFIQDNQSKSTKFTVRGLHFQKGEFAQSKLVRVTQGIIWDVAVDLRKESPTFGQWHGVEISDTNFKQLFVPKGFAHGFSVLSETAIVEYKVDAPYSKESEGGIIFSDSELAIDWKVPINETVISEKDKELGSFSSLKDSL